MDVEVGRRQEQEDLHSSPESEEDVILEGSFLSHMELQVDGLLTWPHALVKQGLEEELHAAASDWRKYCKARTSSACFATWCKDLMSLAMILLGIAIIGRLCQGISSNTPYILITASMMGASFVVVVTKGMLLLRNMVQRRDWAEVKNLAESIRPVVGQKGLIVDAEVACVGRLYRLVFVAPVVSFDRSLASVVTFTADQGEGNNSQLQCAICLADFVCGDSVALLPCAHRFHTDCAEQWLRREFKCPMCRRDIRRQSKSISAAPTDAAALTTVLAESVEGEASISAAPTNAAAITTVLAESVLRLAPSEHDEEDTVVVIL